MELMPWATKKKKQSQPYSSGTMEYAAAAQAPTATGTGTSPTFYRNGNPLYYNTDRKGYREEGMRQYGVGSEYHKGLDDQGKIDFIKKFSGDRAAGLAQAGTGLSDRVSQALAGVGRGSQSSQRNWQEGLANTRQNMLDKAYAKAAGHAYGLKGVKNEAVLSQLGKPGAHREWKEVVDNVTGKSLGYYSEDQGSGRGGLGSDLKSSWDRNQAAWQAGIGAVSGLVLSGFNPLGAVAGGLSGYASGKKTDDARKMARHMQRADKKANFAEWNRPARSLRDVARSRAAGAGTFNYTEQAEV